MPILFGLLEKDFCYEEYKILQNFSKRNTFNSITCRSERDSAQQMVVAVPSGLQREQSRTEQDRECDTPTYQSIFLQNTAVISM